MVQLATEIRWQDRQFVLPMERILLTEQWGYDAVFAAEGLGSDPLTSLAFVAARTQHLRLGTRILQVSGRAPAVTAMAVQTLDRIAGGDRVICGLGSSMPVVVEGLHGRPWGRPVARMRDYVSVMRQAFGGDPIDHVGSEWSAPYRGDGATGQQPIPLTLETNPRIPIILAASGPQMTALAAEIADGWMPPLFMPGMLPMFVPLLEQGFARAGGGKTLADFAIWGHVDVLVDDDVRAAMRPFKEYTVEWCEMQRPMIEARGYGEAIARVIELKTAGRRDEAIASVPDEYIDEGWLVGPVARISERVAPWLDCGLTGLIVRYGPQVSDEPPVEHLDVFRAIAQAAGKERRG
jgi:F420-dependent oxidoreductase-like protein